MKEYIHNMGRLGRVLCPTSWRGGRRPLTPGLADVPCGNPEQKQRNNQEVRYKGINGDAAVLFYRFFSTDLNPPRRRHLWNCTEVCDKKDG